MSKVYSAIPSIVLDKRRVKSDGSFPVKLRITHNRDQRYFSLGINLLEEEWVKFQNASHSEGRMKDERLKEIRIKLYGTNGYLQTAKKIIDRLAFFNFIDFEREFFQKNQPTKSKNDVYEYFDFYIEKLTNQKRLGTASSYSTAKNSLQIFKKNLTFSELSPDLLEMYENKMIALNKSPSTIGIYLRSLRTIINLAISEGIFMKENYPFGRNKYEIPATKNIKKALTLEEISKIFHYEVEEFTSKDKAKDFWIFSYLCNGINIKDICLLKWTNIKDSKIRFIRSKTERSKKSNQKEIIAVLTPEIQLIIDKWGNTKKLNNDYVFPILEHNLTPKRERELVQYFTKTTNKWMKRIAGELNIESNLTTYVARHSFSTVLKRSGVSIEYISESLGHQDLKTTEHYLDSFENGEMEKNAKHLTNFLK